MATRAKELSDLGNSGHLNVHDDGTVTLEGGNVGIGDANPSNLLSVDGSSSGNFISIIKNTHNSNGSGLKVMGGDDANTTAFRVTDYNNNSLVEVQGGGKVGVGQTEPFAQVHSEINSATGAGAGSSGALWLRNRNQTDGNAATIFWGDDESAAMGAINLMHDSYSNNYGSIDIDTRGASGYNTKLTITSGGDIVAKNTGLDTYVHRKITNAGSGSATRYIVINKTDIGAAFKFVGKIVGSRGTGVSASNWAMLDVGFDLNNSGQYPKFGVNYQSGYHANLYGHMTAQWVSMDWDDGNGSATWWALQLSSSSSSNWPADLDNMAFSGYVHNVANDSGEIIVIEDATQTITNITPLGRGQTTVFNHSHVGISTNNPQTVLHINESNPEIRIQPAADTDTSRIRFRNAADNSSRGQIAYDHTNQKLVLNVTDDHVWLTNAGKVGIGTDDPDMELEVYNGSPSTNTGIKIHNDSSSHAAKIELAAEREADGADINQILVSNKGNNVTNIRSHRVGDDGASLNFYTSDTGTGDAMALALSIDQYQNLVATSGYVLAGDSAGYSTNVTHSSTLFRQFQPIYTSAYSHEYGTIFSMNNTTNGNYHWHLLMPTAWAGKFKLTVTTQRSGGEYIFGTSSITGYKYTEGDGDFRHLSMQELENTNSGYGYNFYMDDYITGYLANSATDTSENFSGSSANFFIVRIPITINSFGSGSVEFWAKLETHGPNRNDTGFLIGVV